MIHPKYTLADKRRLPTAKTYFSACFTPDELAMRRTDKDDRLGRIVTPQLMGDPRPGQSALDRRK